MGRIVREGEKLRLRIAEEGDLDFILASEADPENAKYIIADSRAYHLDTLNSPGGVHFILCRTVRRVPKRATKRAVRVYLHFRKSML